MTANHPRLWFNAEELKQLRASATSGVRAQTLARMKHVCKALITPGHPQYLDYKEHNSEDWRTRHGNFRIVPSISALAVGYAFTGEPAFGDAARDALMVIIDHGIADVKSMCYGAPNDGWRHGPGHDKGKFAKMVATVYDLCYDRLTDGQRNRIAEYARECIKIAAELTRVDIDQIANNRGIRGLAVKPWLYAALSGDFDLGEEPQKVFDAALYQLDIHLFLCIDNDGAPYEGPGYVGSVAGLTLLAESLRRQGGADLTRHNRFERLMDYFVYEMVPGGRSANNLNDADQPCGSVLAALPLMGSNRAAALPWLAQQLDLHPDRRGNWLDSDEFELSDHHASGLLMMMLWWRDDQPVKTPVQLGYPTSNCFPTRGVASLRTGWDKNDWLVSHTCGRQERRCHRQGDYNHVAFYADGEHFLEDAGYGKHTRVDPTKEVNRWYAATEAHNCVMIDGQFFRDVFNNPGWCDGDMIEFQEAADFVTSLGDASQCMGKDHQVRKSLRRVVLVRGGPAKYLAVIDLVENDGKPFNATATWQTVIGQSILVNGRGFVIRGVDRDCAAQVLHPAEVTLTQRDHYSLPQVRVDTRGSVVEYVTVFSPIDRGGKAPTFSCKRTGEGAFAITCEAGGKKSVLHASAAVSAPMRRATAVRLEV